MSALLACLGAQGGKRGMKRRKEERGNWKEGLRVEKGIELVVVRAGSGSCTSSLTGIGFRPNVTWQSDDLETYDLQ